MFNYELPKGRIASRPSGLHSSRDDAKLLHVRFANAQSAGLADLHVRNFAEILREGDVLILNNTKVRPFRFFPTLNSKECEVLLVDQIAGTPNEREHTWECLARPMKRFKVGHSGPLSSMIDYEVEGRNDAGDRLVLRLRGAEGRNLVELIQQEGLLPIPPYIRGGHSDELDTDLYQTIFADVPGSIAAPTAGLHFTPSLFEALDARGVECHKLTLHVGVGSFLPIAEQEQAEHQMIAERYCIPEAVRNAVGRAKAGEGRLIAVGTTVVRALEGMAAEDSTYFDLGRTPEDEIFRSTNIFISPGFSFRVVDALFTNFHQPRSTHLSLVSAFAGQEVIKQAYEHALASDYRFLSYGDAMFLEPGLSKA